MTILKATNLMNALILWRLLSHKNHVHTICLTSAPVSEKWLEANNTKYAAKNEYIKQIETTYDGFELLTNF